MPKIHYQITSHDSSHETKLTSDEVKAIRKNCQKNGVLDLSKFKDTSFCFLSLKEIYLKSGDEKGFHERFEHFKNTGSLAKDKNAHEINAHDKTLMKKIKTFKKMQKIGICKMIR